MTAPRRMMMAAAGVPGGAGQNDLFTWGRANLGTLGNGTGAPNLSSPVQLGSSDLWTSICMTDNSAAAIKSDGTLWTWGYAGKGRLANGTTTPDVSSPVQIGSLTDWSVICFQAERTIFAIKTDGTLWGWGDNAKGQLGDGTTTTRSSPVQIGALTNWSLITAGAQQAHAIKTDGTLWGWGYSNYVGGVGDNTLTNRSSPVQIGALTTWSKVINALHGGHAIKTDGTLWGWGESRFEGRIGDGAKTVRSSPVQIGALTDWADIANCGRKSRVAVKTGGTLWGWGDGTERRIPWDNTTDYSSPIQVGALTDWSKVFGRGEGNGGAAIKTDGTLWGWGRNNYGKIGLGNTTQYSSPVQVGALTTWSENFSAGGSNTAHIVIPA